MKAIWTGEPAWVKNQHIKPDATPATSAATSAATTPEPAATVTPSAATPPAPAAAPLDTNALAQAIVRANAQAQAATAAGQPAPQLTPEQIKQQLGIYEMSAADYEETYGVKPTDQQLAAHNRVLQAAVKQAVTIAQILQQQQLATFQQRIDPYITAVRSQEAERQQHIFFSENSDLRGYEPLVRQSFDLAMASGQKFPSVDAARKFVADQTRETLKKLGITPGAAAPTQTRTTTSPQTPNRQMTTTSVGGRSGGSATASKPHSMIEAVWGKQ